MKTLREYLDQLDEIDRRGFLKGMGAAAGAATLGSVAKKVKATTPDSERSITMILVLYYACQNPGPSGWKPNDQVCQTTKDLLQQFRRKYSDGATYLQGAYAGVYDSMEKMIDAALKGGPVPRLYSAMNSDTALQQKTLRDFKNNWLEFNESVEEGIKSKLAGAALAGALAMNPAQADTVDKYTPLNQMKADTAYKIAIAKKRGAAGLPLNMPDVTGPVTKETSLSNLDILDAYNMARAEAGIKPIYPTDKIKEQDLEEASPDAVKRIEQLVRYK